MSTPIKTPRGIVFLFGLCLIFPCTSFAQELNLQKISASQQEDVTVFNLEFETSEAELATQLKSNLAGYDSISVDSYQFVTVKGERALRINSYLHNPETNQKLRWLIKGEYEERAKQLVLGEEQLLSGKFIQFGAFNNFQYANGLSQRIRDFDVEIIRINDQYKLVAPYSLEDYRKARTIYKDAWPVEYKKGSLVVSN